MNKKEERLTAYHEAGHAVAYRFFGQGLKSITIVPDYERGVYGGTVPAGAPYAPVRRYYNASSVLESRLDFERSIIIRLAGYAAEIRSGFKSNGSIAQLNLLRPGIAVKIYSDRNLPVDPTDDGDFSRVRLYFTSHPFLNGPQLLRKEEHQSYFQWLWLRAVNLITEEATWEAVEALAAALFERKKLTGEQAEKVLAKHPPNNFFAQLHSSGVRVTAQSKKSRKRRADGG